MQRIPRMSRGLRREFIGFGRKTGDAATALRLQMVAELAAGRTLKQATTRPAAANMLQQQERFDEFVNEFNHIRPQEALDDNTPASVYRASATPFPDEPTALSYPFHAFDCLVYDSGKIHVPSDPHGDVFIGRVLAGQRVGLRELAYAQWLVSFLDLDLGIIEAGKKRSPTSLPATLPSQ